ncbi:ABC transporter substrate-binding protein [Pirellulaceae bacterium SH501]
MHRQLILLFPLALCLIAGCGASDKKTPDKERAPEKVVIGISPFQDTLLPLIGERKGWYKEEGLDVEIRILGWTEIQEALASGAIDVGINNISAIISTHEKAPSLVYAYGINTFDDGFALMVRPDGKMKTLGTILNEHESREDAVKAVAAQLKGKTVITTSNTDMEQGVAAAARRGGIDFGKDIKIVDLNPDEGLAAFLAGEGDAYIGGIPQRSRAEKEGMLALLTGADLGPPPINGFVTTKSFAHERRESLLRIIKVWFRIVNHVNADIDEAGKIVVDELNKQSGADFTLADFKRFWNQIEHYPSSTREIETEILSPNGRNYWKARWDDCNLYFMNKESIRERVKPDGIFIMPEIHEDYKKRFEANQSVPKAAANAHSRAPIYAMANWSSRH